MLMKPTAYLINVARGELIDEHALVDADEVPEPVEEVGEVVEMTLEGELDPDLLIRNWVPGLGTLARLGMTMWKRGRATRRARA